MTHPFTIWTDRLVKPLFRPLQPYSRVRYRDVDVYYKRFLDGGGRGFGQDFISFFRARGLPRQSRLFEWCAGPAFIGFSLLAHGFCDTLCLADVNPAAVRAARTTVRRNRLADRVSVYRSDNLADIPPGERWNIVVANPPHFDDGAFHGDIRAYDKDWHLHRAFFRDVARFLAPSGVIVLQENNRGSTVETFRAMIADAGLKVVLVQDARPELTPNPHFYYVAIMRSADPPPEWAQQ